MPVLGALRPWSQRRQSNDGVEGGQDTVQQAVSMAGRYTSVARGASCTPVEPSASMVGHYSSYDRPVRQSLRQSLRHSQGGQDLQRADSDMFAHKSSSAASLPMSSPGSRLSRRDSIPEKHATVFNEDEEEEAVEQGPIAQQILSGVQEVLASQLRLEKELQRGTVRDRDTDFMGSEGGEDFQGSIPTFASRASRALPQSWPSNVPLRQEVEDVLVAHNLSRESKFDEHDPNGMDANGSLHSLSSRCDFGTVQRRRLGPDLPLHPNSNTCMTWDCLGFLVLLHDVCITPLLVAWEVPMTGGLLVCSFFSTVYWMGALVVELNTGYYKHGELIMDECAIKRRYLRSWFPFDVSLSFSDLLVAVFHVFGEYATEVTQTLIRVSKICRLLKVIRLVRVSRVLNKLTGRFITTRLGNCLLQAAKVVFTVLIYNHCVCCAWFMAGQNSQGASWLQQVEGGNDMLYQYLTSFHWTLAQMTPGPINIVASNSAERAFNCCLLIIGLLFGSSIVSLVTGQIMQIIILQRDKTQKLDTLQSFLRQNAIRPSLAYSIQRQVTQRLECQTFLEEKQVPALQYLSVQLRQELTVASRRPHLLVHPLFQVWAELNPEVLRGLSLHGTRAIFQPAQDEMFCPGIPIHAAYFLITGQVVYTQFPGSSMVTEDVAKTVPLKSWICEAALWSTWQAVGLLESVSECHFVAVEVKDLYGVLQMFPNVADMTKHYARAFHLRIISAVPPHAPWPTDLSVPFTDSADLLSAQVGIKTLQRARQKGRIELSDEVNEELEDEVRKEKCAIERTMDGKVQRIVAVVALRVYRSDGRFLAQLGQWDEAKGAKVNVTLPGTKRRTGELPQAAFQRVLNEDLSPIKALVGVDHIHNQSEEKKSDKFKMPTVYNRAVHYCNLEAPVGEFMPLWLPPDATELPIELHSVARKGGGRLLFGWLTDEDFGYYATQAGGELVKKWLQMVGLTSTRINIAADAWQISDEGLHALALSRSRCGSSSGCA